MLSLQEMVKHGQYTKTLTIKERLPHFVTAPCELNVTYEAEAREKFYLIRLHVKGELHLQCQRCLDEYNFAYDNQTVIAVCRDEERAESLLEHYECIVSANYQITLDDLIIDELHLYAPQFHEEVKDCSSEINQFFAEINDPN